MTGSNCNGENIKKPNVSGQFYSSNPARLSLQLDTFLNNSEVRSYDKKIEIERRIL